MAVAEWLRSKVLRLVPGLNSGYCFFALFFCPFFILLRLHQDWFLFHISVVYRLILFFATKGASPMLDLATN